MINISDIGKNHGLDRAIGVSPWSEGENKENARRIMARNVDRDSVGCNLSPQHKAAAVEFAVRVWHGNMQNGKAAEMGILHVTTASGNRLQS